MNLSYRPELDGLRAVAVVAILLFHADASVLGWHVARGGFLGVDVFFVISGYLITGIVLTELGAGTFSFARFYERRARRILPALILVMGACFPAAWLWMTPEQLKNFSQSAFATAAFASNIFFWIDTNYFAESIHLKPLSHTWSLAVEEQFYLAFPVFLTCRIHDGSDFGLADVA
jgi:peptidoglycan/LPS O-acetylase OafA/YrhL